MTLDVYLDTQDLSRLFKGRSESDREILDKLLAYKASGAARYVFSFWHVLEFIQKPERGYEAEHRRKAKFLYDLCGQNALAHHDDILSGTPDLQTRAIWIPRSSIKTLTFDYKRLFAEAVDSRPGLNRKQRRTLKSGSVSGRLMGMAANLETYIERDLPITEKFKSEKTLTKFIRGEISDEEFGLRLAELFCSPPVFYDQWYADGRRDHLLSDMAREMGSKLISSLDKAQKILPSFMEARRELKRARANYYNAKRKLLEMGLETDFDEARFKKMPALDVDELLADMAIEERFRYLKHYFWKVARGSPYKANDAIDLLHLFYVPDVDLMRCDIGMYNIMSDCKYFEESKLVAKLGQLPDRIDEKLAAS
tara:strand:- start:170 stop:1270 length:1101 start_codon:yes stop_codon:yes gene_type:complete